MNRRLVAGLTVVVIAVGVVGFPGSAAQHAQSSFSDDSGQHAQQEFEPFVQEGQEFDQTIFRIRVFPDGDIRWTLEQYRQIPFNDEDAIDNFGEFAASFRTNDTEAFQNFKLRAERLTAQGTNATNREMRASNFSRDAFYQDRLQRGVVQLSFRWQNFAPVDGDEVTVADVLVGFALLEEQHLEVVAAENLTFQSVSPAPDVDERDTTSGTESVAWRGPQDFGDSLELVVGPEASDGTPNGNSDDGSTDDDSTDGQTSDDANSTDDGNGDKGSGGQSGMLMPVLAALLVVLGVGGGAVWYTLSQAEAESDQTEPTTTETTDTPPFEQESGAAVSEQELLSDEDLVLQLLEDNGGRMRQVSIVEETEWSKSKVSMLLSDMEEEGEISKLRVGRENIISLAGEEPEAAGSPFETENGE